MNRLSDSAIESVCLDNAVAASIGLEESLEAFLRDYVRVDESTATEARDFFERCCRRLEALEIVVEVLPSGSFARGTCVRPLHDIDALVRFDVAKLREFGAHDRTNWGLSFLDYTAVQNWRRGGPTVSPSGASAGANRSVSGVRSRPVLKSRGAPVPSDCWQCPPSRRIGRPPVRRDSECDASQTCV